MKHSTKSAAAAALLALGVSVSANAAPACGIQSAIEDAAGQFDRTTGSIISNTSTEVGDLGARACIDDLLDIGGSISATGFSISRIIDGLRQKVCNAALDFEQRQIYKLNNALPAFDGDRIAVTKGNRGEISKRYGNNRYNADDVWDALN